MIEAALSLGEGRGIGRMEADYPVDRYPTRPVPVPKLELPPKPFPTPHPTRPLPPPAEIAGCLIVLGVIGLVVFAISTLATVVGPIIALALARGLVLAGRAGGLGKAMDKSTSRAGRTQAQDVRRWERDCAAIEQRNADNLKQWEAVCTELRRRHDEALNNRGFVNAVECRRLRIAAGWGKAPDGLQPGVFHNSDSVGPTEAQLFLELKKRWCQTYHQYPVRIGRFDSHIDIAVFDPFIGARIAIEADGLQHWTDERQHAIDLERETELVAQGWIVIRFSNSQIRRDTAGCALAVSQLLVDYNSEGGRIQPRRLARILATRRGG